MPGGHASDDEDDDPPAPTTHRRRSHRVAPSKRAPVKRWSDEDEEDDADDEPSGKNRSGVVKRAEKEPVYFRARDSVFFEPLVALMVIVVLLVGLFAYTQNWPPMYVVESMSMQHGENDIVGLINTGDLVLAQKISENQIVPYVVGAQTGYSTYGEYGDVILYNPNGQATGAPIIHRAIVFVDINSNGTASVPELSGLPCGHASNAVYSVSSTLTGCGTIGIRGTLTLYHVGWMNAQVPIPLSQFISAGYGSGFVTMGDNNFQAYNGVTGDIDEPTLTAPVQPGWIVGAARGMLPWFGAVKLLLENNASEVPPQSWQWLGLTVVALIALAIGIHFLLRREGIEDERRKADEEAAAESEDDDSEDDDEGGGGFDWRHPLRRKADDEDEEESPPRRRRSGKESGVDDDDDAPHKGRPKPRVGRSGSSQNDDEDL